MRILKVSFVLATVVMALTANAQTATAAPSVPSATQLVKAAGAQAKKEGKNVLVVFHASWCGWCHRFDKFWESPEIAGFAKKSLVTIHVTVMENDEKHKADMNPGGAELLASLGGGKTGIPFMAIIKPDGKMIVNSNENGDDKKNIGYPGAPNEIAHFMKMLKMGAPKLSPADLKVIETTLVKIAPKG